MATNDILDLLQTDDGTWSAPPSPGLDALDQYFLSVMQSPERISFPMDLPSQPEYVPELPTQTAESPSPFAHVMELLAYLDRPRNAVASGVYGYQHGENPLKAALEGLTGEREVSWGDVVGIPQTSEADTWGEWAPKAVGRLALDVAGDPLNLLFGTGAITKALGLSSKGVSAASRLAKAAGSERLMSGLAGSQAGKAWMNRLPSGRLVEDLPVTGEEIERTIDRINREGSLLPLKDAATQARKDIEKLRAENPELAGKTDAEITQAMERAGSPEAVKELQPFVEVTQPLYDVRQQAFDRLNDVRQRLNMDPIENISVAGEYAQMPRKISAEGRWLVGNSVGPAMESGFKGEKAREIFNWRDPNGDLLYRGTAEKGKILEGTDEFGNTVYYYNAKKSRLPAHTEIVDGKEVKVPSQWAIVDRDNPSVLARTVEKHQADFLEAKEIAPKRLWQEDPVRSLYESGKATTGKANFLELVDTGINDGWLRLHPGGAPVEGFRALRIPDMGDVLAPKAVANRLENLYQIQADPAHAIGKIEELFNVFRRSQVGQLLNASTDFWKRNVLGLFPGFHAANAVTNAVLAWLGGVRNPVSALEAGKILGKSGKDIIRGMSGKELWEAFRLRDLVDTGQVNQLGEQIFQGMRPDKKDFVKAFTDWAGAPGRGAQEVSDLWRRANDKGFWVGQKIEEHARLTVAVDYLKRNLKAGEEITPELLDRAARHSKDFLFDYGDLTPIERGLKQFLPFVAWQSNITRRTLQDVMTQPQRLANLSRTLDTAFTPMSEEDKALMQPDQAAQSPVAGIAGGTFEPSEDMTPQIAMLSRFLPQGTIAEFLSKPGQSAFGYLAPQYKAAFEIPFNWNSFKQREIDKLAGGGFSALTNPITGGPYETAASRLIGFSLPAGWDYAVRQSPASRYLTTADAMARGATEGIEDPYHPTLPWDEKIGWLATGGKKQNYDPTRRRIQIQAEQRRKQFDITADLNYATSRGDMEGQAHYIEELLKFNERRAMLEGGN